ncbi:MAG TPA: NAD-dependent epimerase/dehydratase family protein [Gemmataceae bacterium]|nr:NAD-dependent epimerase/dehydratase family protein [Gemmataceae bacterium]
MHSQQHGSARQAILITGGAGCIGSDLAEVLVARGQDVTVFDNLSSGKKEHIEALLGRPNFRFIEADLLDPAALDAGVSGQDMVYHLAANPDVKFVAGEATDKDLRQNTLATYHLLEAMRRHGVRQLAFASTSAVYGITDRLPITESQPCRPISLYGASKLACEALISAFQNLFDMRCWVFRFANIVGSKVRKNGRTVIADFIDKLRNNPRRLDILGNGKQAKSYLASSECVAGMLHAVEHAEEDLSVYNLGCDDWLTVKRIADMVVEALGLSDVCYHYSGTEGGWPGDVPRFRLDVTAVNRLGWKAQHNSEAAVAEAIRATLRVGVPPSGGYQAG